MQGDVPRSGIAFGILTESLTPPEVVTALASRGCAAVVIGIPQGGGFNLYLSGAPSFVNVGFPATMVSGQAFVYRCSGETPTVPVATATASPTAPLAPASAALPARDCMPGTTVRRVGTGALARFGMLPTSGTLRGRVIFIDYADASGTTTDVAGARDNAARVSSAISTQSAGRLGIQFEVAASWVRLPQPKAYYWASGSTDEHPDFVAAVSPSVAAATEDFLVLFDAGNPRSGVSYAGLFEFDSRSRSAKPRVVTSSAQSSVWLHDMLHLLGLPDLYNEEASTAQQSARLAWMGSWDTISLASANAIAAWRRWELGWLPDSGVRCLTADSTEIDLTFATPGGEGTQLAVVRTGLQTALAVELRQSGVVPACTEGVLAYRVDASKPRTDGPLRLLPGGLTAAAVFPAPCTSSYRTATDSYRWDAPLDLAPGRGASVTDSESGVRVEVVSKAGGAWRVRVTQPAGMARPPYTTGRLTLRVTGSRIPRTKGWSGSCMTCA